MANGGLTVQNIQQSRLCFPTFILFFKVFLTCQEPGQRCLQSLLIKCLDRNPPQVLLSKWSAFNQRAPTGVFLKWWYPTTMAFPTKNDHFGVFWGYRQKRKHLTIDSTEMTYDGLPPTWPDLTYCHLSKLRWAFPNGHLYEHLKDGVFKVSLISKCKGERSIRINLLKTFEDHLLSTCARFHRRNTTKTTCWKHRNSTINLNPGEFTTRFH